MNYFNIIKSLLLSFLLSFLIYEPNLLSKGYNKHSDYNYSFENTDALVIPVNIKKNKINLPAFTDTFQTAFLEVDLRTSVMGRLFQPSTEIYSERINDRQYFEYGAKGIRYINISSLINDVKTSIYFKFHQCHTKNDEVKLILFKNPNIEDENLLVLAPHPDDAEIAAYGLYSSNNNAFIATITIGDAGKKMYDELYFNDTIHYLKKAEIRFWNSITVPMLAGIHSQNIVNMGYFDASLKKMYSDTTGYAKARYSGIEDINVYREKNISPFLNSITGASNWRSLVNDLKYIIKIKKPTVIVTPYPAIDVHFDHKLTTIALIQALKELKYTNTELWLYTNHFVHDELYPRGKVRSIVSLPPNTVEKPIYFRRICSYSLSDIKQSDKTLALEAMNPLRPDTEWHTIKGSRELYWKTFREKFRNTETDYYYRRAIRNNELFFVVDIKDLLNDSIHQLIRGDINY